MTNPDQNQDDSYSSIQEIILKWNDGKRPLSGFVKELIAHEQASIDKAVAEDKEQLLPAYHNQLIELLKTLRPARPEDLSMSQWYGLVEAIDAGIQSAQDSLAALTAPKERKK